MPTTKLPNHPKDSNQTWFYYQDTSPSDENPLLGFRKDRLSPVHPLPGRLTTAEWAKYRATFSKIRALLANGLAGVDLVRCWVAWRIIPLSRRPELMCTYTGDTKDPLRHSSLCLDDKGINNMTKSLLGESLESCSKIGLILRY